MTEERLLQSLDNTFAVALSGGLGNQMFQYALGRSLALRRGAQLVLDTRPLDQDSQRSFALADFALEARPANAKQIAALPRPRHRRLRRLPQWPGSVRYVAEPGFAFAARILQTAAPAYLDGFWQSEKYFGDKAEAVRADFQLRQPLHPNRQAIAELIDNSQAVSVHVRRGDYVTNATANSYHGTCEPDWYRRARAIIEQHCAGARYFVFSDDPAWAQANLAMPASTCFVRPSNDGRDHEDLHLMARCRHHIVANSSFSWWGAWLNPAADKQVVAPAQWFRDATIDTRDLLPSQWLRL
ncbi:MAG: alpha-1,2-fucosyltransferase [Candidatus Devosia phytovorans]|uniref:Alpha-1,2-fucosyltransferase n=1 Tax=Candidatus Devosia phytovorans TaxID=3121372 RepID=A0AAJ5VTB6_9HYPH|nr:alpha-1,2-fucosyltransferase [Devosia sp.]WEK03790.1 MAG: alpha-1,2-fucosyltransferase [Devosia sp.]